MSEDVNQRIQALRDSNNSKFRDYEAARAKCVAALQAIAVEIDAIARTIPDLDTKNCLLFDPGPRNLSDSRIDLVEDGFWAHPYGEIILATPGGGSISYNPFSDHWFCDKGASGVEVNRSGAIEAYKENVADYVVNQLPRLNTIDESQAKLNAEWAQMEKGRLEFEALVKRNRAADDAKARFILHSVIGGIILVAVLFAWRIWDIISHP